MEMNARPERTSYVEVCCGDISGEAVIQHVELSRDVCGDSDMSIEMHG